MGSPTSLFHFQPPLLLVARMSPLKDTLNRTLGNGPPTSSLPHIHTQHMQAPSVMRKGESYGMSASVSISAEDTFQCVRVVKSVPLTM